MTKNYKNMITCHLRTEEINPLPYPTPISHLVPLVENFSFPIHRHLVATQPRNRVGSSPYFRCTFSVLPLYWIQTIYREGTEQVQRRYIQIPVLRRHLSLLNIDYQFFFEQLLFSLYFCNGLKHTNTTQLYE